MFVSKNTPGNRKSPSKIKRGCGEISKTKGTYHTPGTLCGQGRGGGRRPRVAEDTPACCWRHGLLDVGDADAGNRLLTRRKGRGDQPRPFCPQGDEAGVFGFWPDREEGDVPTTCPHPVFEPRLSPFHTIHNLVRASSYTERQAWQQLKLKTLTNKPEKVKGAAVWHDMAWYVNPGHVAACTGNGGVLPGACTSMSLTACATPAFSVPPVDPNHKQNGG